MAKAYLFGKAALDETLMARRQAMEAEQAESMARLDALEAQYRLKLDACQLWPVNENEAKAHES